MPPPLVTLIFDLLTLKVVSELRVTRATSVPILVFLGLRLDVRDRQTSNMKPYLTYRIIPCLVTLTDL